MAERIIIDDGSKLYEVYSTDGRKLCDLRFNPSDTNIMKRHKEITDDLERLQESLKNGEDFNSDKMIEIQDAICEKMGTFIGGDSLTSILSVCGMFTPMENGTLFIANVLDSIGAIIEKETAERMKKVNSKMDEYLKDYKK